MSERLEVLKQEWYQKGRDEGYEEAEDYYLHQLNIRNKIIEKLELQIEKLEGTL